MLSNHHLENKELSLRSKGLLSVILSLPDNWDFTIRGLAAISREGVDAIRSSICELEGAGYVKRRHLKSSSGKFSKTEYTFYEVPRQKECDTENNVEETSVSEIPISDNHVGSNAIFCSISFRSSSVTGHLNIIFLLRLLILIPPYFFWIWD